MIRIASFLLIAFCLTSCYTTQVHSDYNRAVDFKQYKSFAWLPRTDSIHNFFYDNQLVEKNVKYLSNMEMIKKGYRIDTLEPDLLLEYHLTSQKKIYTVNNPPNYGYGYNPYGFNNPYGYNSPYNNPYNRAYTQQQVEYLEGTLLIDVIDRRTNELVWRGWSIASVDHEAQIETELPSDVRRIFAKFPVQASPALVKQQPRRTISPSGNSNSRPELKKKKTKRSSSGNTDEI